MLASPRVIAFVVAFVFFTGALALSEKHVARWYDREKLEPLQLRRVARGWRFVSLGVALLVYGSVSRSGLMIVAGAGAVVFGRMMVGGRRR